MISLSRQSLSHSVSRDILEVVWESDSLAAIVAFMRFLHPVVFRVHNMEFVDVCWQEEWPEGIESRVRSETAPALTAHRAREIEEAFNLVDVAFLAPRTKECDAAMEDDALDWLAELVVKSWNASFREQGANLVARIVGEEEGMECGAWITAGRSAVDV